MKRLIVGLVAGAVTVTGAGAAVLARSDHTPAAAEDAPKTTSTARVERRDLVDRERVDGTLGYGPERPVSSPRAGTLTALPAAGSVIERGASLFEVDGRGVPLLYGTRPMWRGLGRGVDDGPDIQQLEENLAALGHTPASTKVDAHWDANTTLAVKRWQQSLGLDDNGLVAVGDLVFWPGAVRVAALAAEIGAAAGPGAPVLDVTGTAQLVTIRLDASRRELAAVGTVVPVELPGGAVVDGTIASVGSVATAESAPGGDSTPRIDVLITLDPAESVNAGAGLDAAPVDVQLTRSSAEGVLAVPVRALLALTEGGYAVEVVDGAAGRLVAVEVGAFADGWVEVRGELNEDDAVVVPA